MPKFNKDSNYTEKTSFSRVIFGAEAPLMEVELNEAQQIIQTKFSRITDVLGNGVFPIDNGSIVHTFEEVDGVINHSIHVLNSVILEKSGMTAFIKDVTFNVTGDSWVCVKIREITSTFEDTITSYGEIGGAPIENTIKDPRTPEETTRRKLIEWEPCYLDINQDCPEMIDDFKVIPLGKCVGVDFEEPEDLNADFTQNDSFFTKVKKLIHTLIGHITNLENPHKVRPEQIGLGNIDNTSDMDKPVSTAQQDALNKKAPLDSPALTGTPTAPTALAGTNTTQIATTAFVQTAIGNGIAASDAMIVKGTIGTSGTVNSLPTTYKTGWTYRVVTDGTYAGQVCEIGDLIIALVDREGTDNSDSDWCVAQTNINGAITGIKNGDAYIAVSQFGSVVTIVHADVTRTDTTSKVSPSHGGTFTAVKSVLSDAKGHVTGVDTETVTLPAYGVAKSNALGMIKSGTDIAVDASGNVTVNDNSHKHTIKNISDFAYAHASHTLWYTYGVQRWIKININSSARWMMSFTIRLYHGYRAVDIQISGYNYGENYWYAPKARIICDSDDSARTMQVKFGYDEVGKLWVAVPDGNYAGITIVDVNNGNSQAVAENLFTINWNLTELSGTVQKTVTAYAPLPSYGGTITGDLTVDNDLTVNGLANIDGRLMTHAFVPDNNGYPKYLLMFDITTWYTSTTTGQSKIGFVGTVTTSREGAGFMHDQIVNLMIGVAYQKVTNEDSINLNLKTSSSNLTPCIVCDATDSASPKYYLALQVTGGGRYMYFTGRFAGTRLMTWLKCTNSSGAMPTGYSVVCNDYKIIPAERAVKDGNGKVIADTYFKHQGEIALADLDTFVERKSGTYRVQRARDSAQLTVFRIGQGSASSLEFFNYYDMATLQVRSSVDNNRYTPWKALAFMDSTVKAANYLQPVNTAGESYNGEFLIQNKFGSKDGDKTWRFWMHVVDMVKDRKYETAVDYATKATKDGNGNVITDTYTRKYRSQNGTYAKLTAILFYSMYMNIPLSTLMSSEFYVYIHDFSLEGVDSELFLVGSDYRADIDVFIVAVAPWFGTSIVTMASDDGASTYKVNMGEKYCGVLGVETYTLDNAKNWTITSTSENVCIIVKATDRY